MKHLKKLIIEKQGISDICLEYKKIIWNNFLFNIKDDLLNNTINSLNYTNRISNNFNFDKDMFKVKNLNIVFNLKQSDIYSCGGITNLEFASYDNETNTLKNPTITLTLVYNTLNKGFFNYVESVLLHEILHVYQRFNQKNKKMDSNWQLGSMIPRFRKESKYINDILELLYYSLKHEMNSQLHQYYDLKQKNVKYKDIYDIINKLDNFNISDIQINNDTIKELNYVRDNYLKSLVYNKPNNLYVKNINTIWKKEININNIIDFLNMLNTIFKKSSEYLKRKIEKINTKVTETIRYDFPSESVIFCECISL